MADAHDFRIREPVRTKVQNYLTQPLPREQPRKNPPWPLTQAPAIPAVLFLIPFSGELRMIK